MVWGGGHTLNITIGRAGFWDHRGGNEFTTKTTYQDVKRLLQTGNYDGIKEAFAIPKTGDQGFGRPQQLGGGRLEITFQDTVQLNYARLFLTLGQITVYMNERQIGKGARKSHGVIITQDPNQEVIEIATNPTFIKSIRLIPAWEAVGTKLKAVQIAPPTEFVELGAVGFTQTLPSDPALSMAYRQKGRSFYVATALGNNAQREVVDRLVSLGDDDPSNKNAVALRKSASQFWSDYWASVPQIKVPDPVLQEIVDYGLYKQACVNPPQGVAGTLQGPFMEDYQIVPWSNDYHFNINVQMIYTPALATNRLSHFGPLWAMMRTWMPTLRQNGETFFGKPGQPANRALMLPHAVDDRCHVVGTFWTGTIDHACTAWMAQMAWQYYRYGLDQPDTSPILTDLTWPLLVGAFEGYYAMLEEVTDSASGQKRFSLPISVSPEYGGNGSEAWGRDASFQLAALHRICRILPEAANVMNQPIDPRWADVDKRLPPYTLVKGEYMSEGHRSNERIGLWQGKDLGGSHRHHSHLAGIYPFATIDLSDSVQRTIVNNSLTAWRFRGAGAWSGWCVPWASILLSRTGQAEAAVNWLHYWNDNYTNEGRGTLHNANNNGTSLFGAPDWTKQAQNREIMQLDGGFGALSAVLELLVQHRDDAIYVLPYLPTTWRNLQFDRVRTEGAFQIGATVSEGRVSEIRIKSLAGGQLRLAHGLGDWFRLNGQVQNGEILNRNCAIGEVLTLTAF